MAGELGGHLVREIALVVEGAILRSLTGTKCVHRRVRLVFLIWTMDMSPEPPGVGNCGPGIDGASEAAQANTGQHSEQ